MTLKRLLDMHAQARGGAAAIEAVNAISVEIEIVEPEFTVSGDYRATREGFMRIDVYADGTRVFTEALGPGGGWQMFADGRVEDLSPEGRAALEQGIESNLFGLHELKARGYGLKFLGAAERNGATFWEAEKTAPGGEAQHLFFDKDTFLVASEIETNALHPDVDSTQVAQETFYSSYNETGGVVFADRTQKRNIETGAVMQTATVAARRINPVLDPAQFERPAH